METFVKKIDGGYVVQFTHGMQTFTLQTFEPTKKHAIWQKEMLDKCFQKFKDDLPPSEKEEPKEQEMSDCDNCSKSPYASQHKGSPEEFVKWWFRSGFMIFAIEGFSDPVLFIKFDEGSKKKYTLDDLFTYWKEEVKDK